MSHGWGSSALVAMQETLLGLSLMEPNPEDTVRVVVAPLSAELARARGSMPTIAGPVAVSCQRRGAGVALDIVVPANASALVHLPASDLECAGERSRGGNGPGGGRLFHPGERRPWSRWEVGPTVSPTGRHHEVQTVPGGGVTPPTRYACTYPRTQAL